MNGMGGNKNMSGQDNMPMGNQEMQDMSSMMDEMKGMMDEMMSSKDMSKMPDMMAKLDEIKSLGAEMMGGWETVPPDEYNKLDTEGKDKADETEIMGKH